MNLGEYIIVKDNTGETFYINEKCIAYLKETPAGATRGSIYKAVLTNDKHIIISNASEFQRIKDRLNIG